MLTNSTLHFPNSFMYYYFPIDIQRKEIQYTRNFFWIDLNETEVDLGLLQHGNR